VARSSRAQQAMRAAGSLVEGADLDPDEYGALRRELTAYLRGVSNTLSDVELQDLLDEAVTRFLGQRERLAGTDPSEALGYLMRTARNALLDRVRRNREFPDQDVVDRSGESAVDDGAVMRLIERNATHAEVHQALKRLRESGQDSTVAIVLKWMNVSSDAGASPSARLIGREMDVEHKTVTNALSRLRTVILEIRGQE
jgi:DNA-directed RNA polymerase specialized sigma24 family protein